MAFHVPEHYGCPLIDIFSNIAVSFGCGRLEHDHLYILLVRLSAFDHAALSLNFRKRVQMGRPHSGSSLAGKTPKRMNSLNLIDMNQRAFRCKRSNAMRCNLFGRTWLCADGRESRTASCEGQAFRPFRQLQPKMDERLSECCVRANGYLYIRIGNMQRGR